ncbi:aliphatic sulfonate ABC transporter substrate-binding protein [Lederbergia sp. NSJ-179]|uniref:aliphatic sulfonate ABC transporter substrate-binding protein n=1 Tax=Lederbergia sp. NSJ-179 TaxID=2931402 RepID=UPI001FD07ABA|nr:aliphatic sulfonate ABC transporter substrate-binding protein [Lederbergia sp. NSJ-179]MCJ7840658.1 aliphatic sulfonate ABC transporter substrate-binding protein [Lederbergia sp. NSJ-179]
MKKLWIGLLLLIVLAGCGNGKSDTVKIGYFPNLTHVATIIGLEKGYFQEELGEKTKIETKTVSNGGLFMEAMTTKAIDIGTVGPGPAINFYVKNPQFHIVSGAVNGGAVLVAGENSGVETLADLDGKRVAIPVIGSTQDVMLRKALQEVDLNVKENGGTVELYAAAPADTASLFVQESVDAAATQEPWGYILETQANGKLLLDWENFAWGKDSTNTVVVAREDFLKNEDQVHAYLRAHQKAVNFIRENPEEAQEIVIKHIKDLTGKEVNAEETTAAFEHLEVTTDVNEQVIKEMAKISKEADYIESDDIEGLINLDYLEKIKE